MKEIFLKISLIAAVALTATVQTANARIWRVNNNPGKSADFTNLTDALRSLNGSALNSVQAGDTIHLEGSVTAYGKDNGEADTIARKVVLIGPGYLLSANPQTQHFQESAKIRTIYIAPTAEETVIAGVEQVAPSSTFYTTGTYSLLSLYRNFSTYSSASNPLLNVSWGNDAGAYKLRIEADFVIVSHCKLFYVDLHNVNKELTNITITKCFFNPGMVATAGDKPVKNLIISNNFFRNDYLTTTNTGNTSYQRNYGNHFCYVTIDLRHWQLTTVNSLEPWHTLTPENWIKVYNENFTYPAVNPIIQNNTFFHAFSIETKGASLYNNIFFPRTNNPERYGLPQDASNPHIARNNIIFNGIAWNTNITAGIDYSNNYGGMLNDGNNSYNVSAEASWFVASTNAAQQGVDNSFQLGNASPARDQTDLNNATKQRGMYGGLSPYKLSGLYTIPAVWEISIPAYPSGEVPSTGFEVRVQVKSH